jgi:hypothetical protein
MTISLSLCWTPLLACHNWSRRLIIYRSCFSLSLSLSSSLLVFVYTESCVGDSLTELLSSEWNCFRMYVRDNLLIIAVALEKAVLCTQVVSSPARSLESTFYGEKTSRAEGFSIFWRVPGTWKSDRDSDASGGGWRPIGLWLGLRWWWCLDGREWCTMGHHHSDGDRRVMHQGNRIQLNRIRMSRATVSWTLSLGPRFPRARSL